MARTKKTRKRKVGLSPGSLVYTGEKLGGPVKLCAIEYSESGVSEREVTLDEACFPYEERSTVTWLNVDGIHDVTILERLGKHFRISPLVLEDILNIDHRPKKEEHSDYLFISIKMLSIGAAGEMVREQVSMILGQNYVITFQEDIAGDVFDSVRERIRGGKGRIRRMGADYLAYALVDVMVDNYFLVLESLGERYEALEERLMDAKDPKVMMEINGAKKQMLIFRKAVWPVRDIVTSLVRDESPLIGRETSVFFRDVYDHVIEVLEISEVLREMVGVLVELYLTNLSNRTNEIMKVLALISTIFMPLTFVAGIYGMNFENMPELTFRYGYPITLAVMGLIALLFMLYFRRRGWM